MRTATPTARGSATSVPRTPSRTARSASRAATACGGGFLMIFRRRPSPSGPSPCGGGAASACAAASTWAAVVFGHFRAVFRAGSWSGRGSAYVDVLDALYGFVATRGLPSSVRRCAGSGFAGVVPADWALDAPGAAAGLRSSIKEAPTRRSKAARVGRAPLTRYWGLPTRLAGTARRAPRRGHTGRGRFLRAHTRRRGSRRRWRSAPSSSSRASGPRHSRARRRTRTSSGG